MNESDGCWGVCCTCTGAGMRTRSAASAEDSEVRQLLAISSQVRSVESALAYTLGLHSPEYVLRLFQTQHVLFFSFLTVYFI